MLLQHILKEAQAPTEDTALVLLVTWRVWSLGGTGKACFERKVWLRAGGQVGGLW